MYIYKCMCGKNSYLSRYVYKSYTSSLIPFFLFFFPCLLFSFSYLIFFSFSSRFSFSSFFSLLFPIFFFFLSFFPLDVQKMGYGSRALDLLLAYFQGEFNDGKQKKKRLFENGEIDRYAYRDT